MSEFLFWVCAGLAFLYLGCQAYLVHAGIWSWPAFVMAAFFIGLAIVHGRNSSKG